MHLGISRSSLWLALVPLAALNCTPDERQLRANARVDSVGEAGSSAGAAGAESESPAGEAGEENVAGRLAGAGVAGVGGAAGSASGNGGTLGIGGNPIINMGGTGTVTGGGAPGGDAGRAAGGASGAGGSSGNGGAPFDSPCGDIDHDLVDDCTETLPLNSRFDTDVTHWTAGSSLTQIWDARDARSKSGSGSILITNQIPIVNADAWVLSGTDQCVPVTENMKYQIAARVMIPDGQGLGGAGLSLYAYTGEACSGIFLKGLATELTVQRGSWVVVDAQLPMPLAARSVLVRLAVSKPFTQDKLSALFDDVLVRAVH